VERPAQPQRQPTWSPSSARTGAAVGRVGRFGAGGSVHGRQAALAGRARAGLDVLTTDRGDASGTGYWSPATGNYRTDLLRRALGAEPHLPTVLGPANSPGRTSTGRCRAGCGYRRQRRCRTGSRLPGSAPRPAGRHGAERGLRLATSTPAHLSTAAVEGVLCGLADGPNALVAQGAGSSGCCSSTGASGPSPCASSHRLCSAAPSWCLRRESYVADGAARPAAWVLSGGEAPPTGGAGERCRSASGRAATSPAPRRSVHARRPPGQRGTPRPTAWHRQRRGPGGLPTRRARVSGCAALRLIYVRVLQHKPYRQASDLSSSATFSCPSDCPPQDPGLPR